MVESTNVMYGLIAGLVAGIVASILFYANMPSVDEVLRAAESHAPGALDRLPEGLARTYISLALKVSGVFVTLFLMILGALAGWLGEEASRKLKVGGRAEPLLASVVFAAILLVPDLALGDSLEDLGINLAATLAYTIAYFTLASLAR